MSNIQNNDFNLYSDDVHLLGRDVPPWITENACPVCSLEPEVLTYIVGRETMKVRGYHCRCGARVVDGILMGIAHC